MGKPATILYIEDDAVERQACLRMVREKGLPWEVTAVETLAAARAYLARSRFDVIVADNHLPDGESPELFGDISDTPFVLVTGTLEEQLALRTLERGADDYLIKDVENRHLAALPYAVEKTLYRKAIHEREQQLTRQLRESDERLRATFANAASGIVETDGHDRLMAVNDRFCQMLGYGREELLGQSMHDLTYPEDRPRSRELNAQLHAGQLQSFAYEKRYLKRDGTPLWVHVAVSAVCDPAGRYLYSVGTVVDISARKAAEAQVRLLAAALEAAPNSISLSQTDPAGTIVWVNPAFTALTGYRPEEAVGQSHHLLSSGQQDAAFYRALWETIKRGETWRGELVNRRKDGTLYQEEMSITPLRDEHGKVTHYVVIKQDITSRKQVEAALRANEERYRLVVDSIPDHAVVLIDAAGRIAGWNPGAERLFGWTKDEITGQPIDVLFTPEDRAAGVPAQELAQAREAGRAGADRWKLRKDGTRFYGAGSVALIGGERGEARAYVKIVSDATQAKLAERVLQESEQTLRGKGSPAGRSGLSRYGVAVGMSAATLGALWLLQPLFGMRGPPWILAGLTVAAVAWWGGLGPGLLATALVALAGWWAFVPPRFSWAIGEDPAEILRWSLLVFSGGAISTIAGAMHRAIARQRRGMERLDNEIRERRTMEAALREQGQMLDLSYDATLAWPLHGTIRYWNSGAERLYGYTRAEALGHVSHELLRTRAEGDIATFLAALERDQDWSGELRHITRDGREVTVESRMVLMPGEAGGEGVVIETNRDITTRKQAEQALHESEQRFRTLADAIPQLAWIAKADGWIYWYNHRWYEYTQTTPEQMEGWGWQRVHDPQILPKVMEQWQASIATGEPFNMTFPLRGADGVFRPFLTRVMPLKDEQGRVVQWFGTNTDVSEQKAIEAALAAAKVSAERAKEAAERASQAKDQFLAVLSHELRNPLTPVLATAAMLEQDPRLDPETREALEMIHRNAELEARLIDDLLDLMRIARGKVELHRRPVALDTILKHAIEVCRPDLEARNLHFGLEVPDTSWVVHADAARLQQVFWNLLKNAIKFTPEGGCVGVRVGGEDDTQVIVEVHDSGLGIEPEALARIFQPFEQAERGVTRQFGGLGLGLAISKAMVEMHGGTISAHSEGKGKGAMFQVRLPLTTARMVPVAEAPLGPAEAAGPVRPPRALRILLVEDHGDTARIMSRLLRAEGHSVTHAADVATALKLAGEQTFDLLVSDLGLPDGSGLDIIRHLRTRGVDWPGIALSGYGQEQDIQQSREAGFAAHITKPMNLPQLTGVIRAVTE